MKQVSIQPSAKADVLSAFSYYEEVGPGLGTEFVHQIYVLMDRIAQFPNSFPEIEPGIRWGLTKQFPFKVFFMPGENPIPVVAVTHASLPPDAWKKKV